MRSAANAARAQNGIAARMMQGAKGLSVPLFALVVATAIVCTAAYAEERLSVLSWNTEHYGWERRPVSATCFGRSIPIRRRTTARHSPCLA